jgi:putative hydrolase of the HAD superfamily
MIDAVILDLGNVLAFHDNAKLFRALAGLFHTDVEGLRAQVDSSVWDRVNRGQLPGDALRLELSSRLEHTPSREDFERAWSCHFTVNEPMVRHTEALVGRVKLVLLSNTHDLHVAHLRPRLPVLERFDGLVLSCEVGLVKPQAEIYARALQCAGVPASRAIFFDDIEAYVEGARAVGIHGQVFRSAADVPSALAALGLKIL